MRKCFLFILLLFSVFNQFPEEKWEKNEEFLGERIKLFINLQNAGKDSFIEGLFLDGTDLEDFRIIKTTKEITDKNIFVTIEVIPFRTGELSFPLKKIKIISDNEEKEVELKIPPLKIKERENLKEPEIANIVELKKKHLLSPLQIALLILFLLIMIVVIYTFSFKNRKMEEKELNQPLEEILLKSLTQKLNRNNFSIQDYLNTLKEFKDYLNNKFHLRCDSLTSFELLNLLRGEKILKFIELENIEQFLKICDFIKFAKHIPEIKDEELLRNFINSFLKEVREDKEFKKVA